MEIACSSQQNKVGDLTFVELLVLGVPKTPLYFGRPWDKQMRKKKMGEQ